MPHSASWLEGRETLSTLGLLLRTCLWCPSCFAAPYLCPPPGLREYMPGIPPGRCDLQLYPREFLPGPAPFRPPGLLGPPRILYSWSWNASTTHWAPGLPTTTCLTGAPALRAQRGTCTSLHTKQPGTCPGSEAEPIMAPLLTGARFFFGFGIQKFILKGF